MSLLAYAGVVEKAFVAQRHLYLNGLLSVEKIKRSLAKLTPALKPTGLWKHSSTISDQTGI